MDADRAARKIQEQRGEEAIQGEAELAEDMKGRRRRRRRCRRGGGYQGGYARNGGGKDGRGEAEESGWKGGGEQPTECSGWPGEPKATEWSGWTSTKITEWLGWLAKPTQLGKSGQPEGLKPMEWTSQLGKMVYHGELVRKGG